MKARRNAHVQTHRTRARIGHRFRRRRLVGTEKPAGRGPAFGEEEKQFLEAQLAMNQKIKAKLDQLNASSGKTPGSGFLGSGNSSNAAAVNDAKADADKQEADLQAHLAKLK